MSIFGDNPFRQAKLGKFKDIIYQYGKVEFIPREESEIPTINFDRAVRVLAKVKGRVIVTGVGKSGHIASKISSTMSSTGTPSQYCSPTDMSHGDLGVISKKDALIVISNSGNSNELSNLLKFSSIKAATLGEWYIKVY